MTRQMGGYIVISVGLGMTVVCGAWLYKPGQRELSTLLESAQAMREQLSRGSGAMEELSTVRADMRHTNQLLENYRIHITPTANVGTFVEEVSAVASHLGLGNRVIVPQTPVDHGTIVGLPIEISYESDFDQSFDFVRSVERLPRAVQVTDFTLKRAKHKARDGGLLRTKLTLCIYYEAT